MLQSLQTQNGEEKPQHGSINSDSPPETYDSLTDALLELYLSVKIRSDEEVTSYYNNGRSITTQKNSFTKKKKR